VKPAKSYAQGPSAGCTKTTGATGLQTRTKVIAGKTRDYLRFIPAGYTPGTPVAVVFGFHGSGGSAAKARSMFDLEAKAGAKAIFIYPQGLPDPAFDGDNRWDPNAGSADYTFIDELLAEVEASHCVARDKVFAVGFSNGARMTSMLGCHRGDRFRAIAPVAPGGNATTLPLSTSACKGEVAIWEGVGTEDTDHLAGAALVRDYYRTANGCTTTKKATTPSGCEAWQGCRTEVPAVYCTYPGGHSWPAIGTNAVWSFFSGF
jgi:polyhydroxybutyrate depolymerase